MNYQKALYTPILNLQKKWGTKHELGLPNHRPIEPLSVYAVPNKNRSRHQMTNSRDVYAQGYK